MGNPTSSTQHLAKRLLAATSGLYRLRLSVLFDSIQLIAPEFYERELYLMTSRPRFGLLIALVFTVEILQV